MPNEFTELKNKIIREAQRVKKLGKWPGHISIDSLVSRIPDEGKTAPGFDAGIACCLDLIPRDKQTLSATLHAAYTPAAVDQVREEIKLLQDKNIIDSNRFTEVVNLETTWWLAACHLCKEGNNTCSDFLSQILAFKESVKYIYERYNNAKAELEHMLQSFTIAGGVPIATSDGGMAGAYVGGYPFAVGIGHGVWFVGTYFPTLGIPHSFNWGTDKDSQGRLKSGPVHGSQQFVKCADLNELNHVVNIARENLKQFMPDES